eukprot:gb/GECH01012424.1/.p1 GENE.gb/GECH01012424.1/~~gb/GECH01012424.1/.p1  ORF type:complete len:475 (+),score=85.35 gb/GECH01012424.1/:1-1425(+)
MKPLFLLSVYWVIMIGITTCIVSSFASLTNNTTRTQQIEHLQTLLSLVEQRILTSIARNENETRETFQSLDDQLAALDRSINKKNFSLHNSTSEVASALDEYEIAKLKLKLVEQYSNTLQLQYNEVKEQNQERKEQLDQLLNNNIQRSESQIDLIHHLRNVFSSLMEKKLKRIGEPCNEEYPCEQNLICQEHACRLPFAAECETNAECVTNLCSEVRVCDSLHIPCDSDNDCYGPYKCGEGKCRRKQGERCEQDQDCYGASSCIYKQCILPTSCNDIHQIHPDAASGVYTLSGFSWRDSLQIWCEMKDDGGWNVIQRRMDGSVDFYRGWNEYVDGFGDVSGEYWLGLENIYFLTSNEKTLLVELEFEGKNYTARYESFQIGDASDYYRLHISGFSGDAGDALDTHDNCRFSTKGEGVTRCARKYSGAWWYESCHSSNLNGLYLDGPHESYANGVNWNDLTGYHYSSKFVQMMIK